MKKEAKKQTSKILIVLAVLVLVIFLTSNAAITGEAKYRVPKRFYKIATQIPSPIPVHKYIAPPGQQTTSQLPVSNPCSNGVKDGLETDVDCGGGNTGGQCPPCLTGKVCNDQTGAAGMNCAAGLNCLWYNSNVAVCGSGCTDTDGGFNVLTAGSVSFNAGQYSINSTDTCSTSSTLKEVTCGYPSGINVNCVTVAPNTTTTNITTQCSAGACV